VGVGLIAAGLWKALPDRKTQKSTGQSNKAVVEAADNAAMTLRSGRSFPAVPHFKRLMKNKE